MQQVITVDINDVIVINDEVSVIIRAGDYPDQVKLQVDAAKHIPVDRKEIYERKLNSNFHGMKDLKARSDSDATSKRK